MQTADMRLFWIKALPNKYTIVKLWPVRVFTKKAKENPVSVLRGEKTAKNALPTFTER